MGNIYSIGKSALLGANYAISVTGHNISNASTPGYNRQVILQSNKHGQQFGFGFVGNGMQLDEVRRVYDEFLGKQFLNTQSEYSRQSTYYNQIAKINNKLADATAGVSPALQEFFSAVQEIASTPTSAATREAMLSEAQILAGRYNNLARQLTEQRDLANSQIINGVNLINTYATEIARLNEQISRAQVSLGDPPPNDLLDQRDYLIAQLSQEIDVRTVPNGNSLDVYIGNGQPLVVNNTSFSMFARYSANDPQTVEVGYVNNGVEVVIPDKLLTGGNLMGYKEYLAKEVDPILNELGRIAITLATDFNEQHKLGIDLNGEQGLDFFRFKSTASRGTSSGGTATSTVTDVRALQASNYEVSFDGSVYSIKRLSDGTVFTDPAWTNPSPSVEVDGVTFSLTGFAIGETVTIKPLNEVAASLSVAISDPNKIAAAFGVRTLADASNLGTGKISPGQVTGTPPAASGTLTYTYDGSTAPPSRLMTADADMWYTAPGATTATFVPAGTAVPYQEGATYDFGNFTFTIEGSPEHGDTFSIEPNLDGAGDNRNMLALAALQDAKTMLNGTATYQGAYSQMVNRVGTKTRELEITSTSTGNLLNEIYEEQQSQSGVNLDEEYINLMKYQQNYNAASKVIQTANEMFDAVLAIF